MSTGKNLAYLGDFVLQEVFVRKMINLLNARAITSSPTVGDFCEFILEEIEISLEAVSLPYFDGEEVVVVPLGLLAGVVLGEE